MRTRRLHTACDGSVNGNRGVYAPLTPMLPPIRGLDGAKVALLLEPDGEADLNRRIENIQKEGKSLADDHTEVLTSFERLAQVRQLLRD